MKNGKPYQVKGPYGKLTYFTKKGEFVWRKNVKPAYFWYNGTIKTLTIADKIDPSRPVAVNRPLGNRNDKNSRITPFKVHRGKQPYDRINKNLVIPKLVGKKGSGACWAEYGWNKAVKEGMDYADFNFSGEIDFVETSYVFPTTHMVAPKVNVVSCNECHIKKGSRLANLSGFYMLGRDRFGGLDLIGWIMVAGALISIFIHAGSRLVYNRKNGKQE